MSSKAFSTIRVFLILLIDFFIAIVPHIALKSFWNMESDYLVYVTVFEALYTFLLLPIVLIKLNKFLFHRIPIKRIKYLISSLIIIIFSILISDFFHNKNFEDMTGHGNDPDTGSKLLSIIIPLIGILIATTDVGIKLLREFKKEN